MAEPPDLAGFLDRHGWGAARHEPLAGDASTRRYVRLQAEGGSAILMISGETPLGPWLRVRALMHEGGVAVPALLAADEPAALALLADAGDLHLADLADASPALEAGLYERALDLLMAVQSIPPPAWLPALGPETLLALLDLFLDELASGHAAARQRFRAVWRPLLTAVTPGHPVLVHRDFHSRNILLDASVVPPGLTLIDFQDAHAGPAAYDLVSLLQDARRNLAPDLAARLQARYAERRGTDPTELAMAMAVLGAQRALRILGVFARLGRTGRGGYAQHLPRVRRHLAANLAHPALGELQGWLQRETPDVLAAG